MSEIHTGRLRLSPYCETDFAEFAKLRSDETVMVSMVGGTLGESEARAVFNAYLAMWEKQDFGMWAVREAESLKYIGECGFWDRGGDVGLTIRYLLHKEHWGQGLASEAVNAALAYGLDMAGITALSAVALRDNHRSCTILEKAGMVVVDENHQGISGFHHYVLPV